MTGASTALRWAALALAVIPAVLLFPTVWADSGGFAVWGLGLPVLLAAVAVTVGAVRPSPLVTWLCAGLLLAWSLLLGLGIGLFFLPAAVTETAAAATQRRPGRLPA